MKPYIYILVVFVFMISCSNKSYQINYVEKSDQIQMPEMIIVDCVDTTTINNYINNNKVFYAYANSESEIRLEELVGGEFKINKQRMDFSKSKYRYLSMGTWKVGKRNPHPFFSKRDYKKNHYYTMDYNYVWKKIGSLLVIKYDIGLYLSKDSPLGWLFGDNGAFMLFTIIDEDRIMTNDIFMKRQSKMNALMDRYYFSANAQRYKPKEELSNSSLIALKIRPRRIISDYEYLYCLNMDYVELPNNVKVIGDFAFSRCYNLREIKFSDSLKKIGEFSFHSCRSIKDVEIPNSVEEIGDYAFLYCDKLESVKLSYSLKKISKGLFQQCTNLKYIRIPEKVESIGNFAFLACDNLKIVVVDSKEPPNIMPFTFDKDNEIEFYVPNESLELYKNHEFWGKMDINPMSDLK